MRGRVTLDGYSVSGRAVFPYFTLYINVCLKYILFNIVNNMYSCSFLINNYFVYRF